LLAGWRLLVGFDWRWLLFVVVVVDILRKRGGERERKKTCTNVFYNF
jgi:hypothetical protein